MEVQFQVGDVVGLKSGGPDMTITGVDLISNDWECKWFSGDTLCFGIFPTGALRKSQRESDISVAFL